MRRSRTLPEQTINSIVIEAVINIATVLIAKQATSAGTLMFAYGVSETNQSER